MIETHVRRLQGFGNCNNETHMPGCQVEIQFTRKSDQSQSKYDIRQKWR